MKTIALHRRSGIALILSSVCVLASPVFADFDDNEWYGGGARKSSQCRQLPGHYALKTALQVATAADTSGYNFEMWGVIVDRDGIVCAVAFSGADRGSQLPGARVISAQKANTANSFSSDFFAFSTANLYTGTQPGGELYGLLNGNPVDTGVAYKGPAKRFGKANDPMVGRRIGGAIPFGGGLALYDGGRIVGALGVGGDSTCADHMIAWRMRHDLSLDEFNMFTAGFSGDPDRPDNIVYDIVTNPNGGTGTSESGVGHPICLNATDPGILPPVVRN